MLWILALAKARSAVLISAAISAKRVTQTSAKINATLEGARQKGSWLRRSFVKARYRAAPHSLLAIRPSASTRDPFQYFNSLLRRAGLNLFSGRRELCTNHALRLIADAKIDPPDVFAHDAKQQ